MRREVVVLKARSTGKRKKGMCRCTECAKLQGFTIILLEGCPNSEEGAALESSLGTRPAYSNRHDSDKGVVPMSSTRNRRLA